VRLQLPIAAPALALALGSAPSGKSPEAAKAIEAA
jgi:hypothetical protein